VSLGPPHLLPQNQGFKRVKHVYNRESCEIWDEILQGRANKLFGNLHTSYFTADFIVLPSSISTFAIQSFAERYHDNNIRRRCTETHFEELVPGTTRIIHKSIKDSSLCAGALILLGSSSDVCQTWRSMRTAAVPRKMLRDASF
jgi:hypothetical protein